MRILIIFLFRLFMKSVFMTIFSNYNMFTWSNVSSEFSGLRIIRHFFGRLFNLAIGIYNIF